MPPTVSAQSGKRRFPLQIKDISADGSFEGILASYNTEDLGGDKIEPGAFTKTIKEHGNEVPLLWQHKTDSPIGMLTLVDGPDALRVKGQLLMELPDARKAYVLIKARVIKGLSIGYDTVKDQIDNGIRFLKEVRLWEGSIVTFPMNEAAMITSVKANGGGGETKDDFNTELAELQLQEAGYQIMCALSYALYSVSWARLARDEKVMAVETILSQFSDAYMSWFPQYLDWQSAEYGDMETMSRLKTEQKEFTAMLGRGVKTMITLHKLKAGVISLDVARGELKEGRKLSAATAKSLKEAHGHVKSMGEACKSVDDIFNALFDSEADDDPADDDEDTAKNLGGTDTPTQSPAAGETKTEPDSGHSAVVEILSGLRSLIPTA